MFVYSSDNLYISPDYAQNALPDGVDAHDEAGQLVIIRKMDTDSQELALLLHFSSLNMRAVSENHCVPILDYFQAPDDAAVTFIVNPYLYRNRDLYWDFTDEVMDFGMQVLEVCNVSI